MQHAACGVRRARARARARAWRAWLPACRACRARPCRRAGRAGRPRRPRRARRARPPLLRTTPLTVTSALSFPYKRYSTTPLRALRPSADLNYAHYETRVSPHYQLIMILLTVQTALAAVGFIVHYRI